MTTRVNHTVTMQPEELAELKALAAELNTTVSGAVRTLLAGARKAHAASVAVNIDPAYEAQRARPYKTLKFLTKEEQRRVFVRRMDRTDRLGK